MPPDLTIRTRGIFTAAIVSNQNFCQGHYRMVVSLDRFPATLPGQFVQILCRRPGPQVSLQETDWPQGRLPDCHQAELTGVEPLLRRPISLAGREDRPDGRVELTIIYRVGGTGTAWLSSVEPDDELSLIGPLGNGFPICPDAPVAALVGGGVGIPPLMYLGRHLATVGREVAAFCGARTKGLLPLTVIPSACVDPEGTPSPCVAEFAAHGVSAALCTDDGSAGLRGFVSTAFERWLDAKNLSPGQLIVYSCGPEHMMQAVARICQARGIPCYLALERHMACGMGTCQSCAVKIAADNDRGWAFKLCCTDGPVFDARQVLW
ncbi:MAG: dihydroorotate dehydrogenase electron transfer subunit [Phycisphaerae bacterium]|jgi:dihydroorotate dehydrogenase electron transfer subunit